MRRKRKRELIEIERELIENGKKEKKSQSKQIIIVSKKFLTSGQDSC
jgi:hypothetical protein